VDLKDWLDREMDYSVMASKFAKKKSLKGYFHTLEG